MPIFTQQKIESKARGRAAASIPKEVIAEYKKYIEQLEKKSVGTLEFKKGDIDINQARKAMLQAAVELKQYVRVRKPRGAGNILNFEHITKKEFLAKQKVAVERGKKLRGKPKIRRKAKAKKG